MSASTATLNDFRTAYAEREEWECPRCTMVNTSDFLNCTACLDGKNPHRRSTASQLVIEQTKRHNEAAQNVERSITDKMRTFVVGWTCPVCGTNTRFDSFCTTCDYSLDPSKPILKHSLKSEKSNVFSSFLGSLRGRFDLKTKSPGTSSVDKNNKFVLVTKDKDGITDETVSPTSLLQQNEEHLLKNSSPAPSLDSGHCTMSDTTSQVGQSDTAASPSDQSDRGIRGGCSSPIACSDPTAESSWTCSICKAYNRAIIGQYKCYVCNIGTAPPNVAPLLFSPNKQHNDIEIANNQTTLENPATNQISTRQNGVERTQQNVPSPQSVSKQQVSCDGPTEIPPQVPRRRPLKLARLHVTETNNNPTQLQRRSFGDECSPSPAKNCTKLMECKRREETNQASEQYRMIRESCLRVRKDTVLNALHNLHIIHVYS